MSMVAMGSPSTMPNWGAFVPPEYVPPHCAGKGLDDPDPYLWDYFEHGKDVGSGDWHREMNCISRVRLIDEHCDEAAKVHDAYLNDKIRLARALSQTRQTADPAEKARIGQLAQDPKLEEVIRSVTASFGDEYAGSLRRLRNELLYELAKSQRAVSDARVQQSVQSGSLSGASSLQAARGGSLGSQYNESNSVFSGAARGRVAALESPLRSVAPTAGKAGENPNILGGQWSSVKAEPLKLPPAPAGRPAPSPLDDPLTVGLLCVGTGVGCALVAVGYFGRRWNRSEAEEQDRK